MRVTKVGPSASTGAGFHCPVSELVELAVISCSGTRFESDESVALRQARGPVFIVRSVSLSNWPLLVAQEPDLRVTKVWPFGKHGAGFHCPVSKLVELAVINCSGTRLESDEGGPFGKHGGRFSLYGQ